MHKTHEPDVAIVGILLEAGADTEATDKVSRIRVSGGRANCIEETIRTNLRDQYMRNVSFSPSLSI